MSSAQNPRQSKVDPNQYLKSADAVSPFIQHADEADQ